MRRGRAACGRVATGLSENAVRAVSKAASHHQVRRRASAMAQAAQLPSLVGPRLLYLRAPFLPCVSMSTLIVVLAPLSFLFAGSSVAGGKVGVWGGAGVGYLDRIGVGVGKAGGGGGDVVVA